MDGLRAQFPVLARTAYLNAGTNGPIPRRAVEAAAASLDRQASAGRGGGPFFDELLGALATLRGRVSALLGCDASEVALTGSTTGGVLAALRALELAAGDEVVTSDEEHPGLLAPLALARARHGIRLRVVPFEEIAHAVSPETRVVACSHVSWVTGRVVDAAALASTRALVLLDGAQGLGALPVDVRALGCDFYAASGQKWLCGPNGSGYLFARAELAARLAPPWPGYGVLSDPSRPLELALHEDARRFDVGLLGPHDVAWALAALDVLEQPGIGAVHARAGNLAAWLANALTDRGLRVAPRGDSTLVSFEADDPPALVERLRERGFVLRSLPATPYVRASVGAWTSEAELERLLAELS